jgi:hypothetical protein
MRSADSLMCNYMPTSGVYRNAFCQVLAPLGRLCGHGFEEMQKTQRCFLYDWYRGADRLLSICRSLLSRWVRNEGERCRLNVAQNVGETITAATRRTQPWKAPSWLANKFSQHMSKTNVCGALCVVVP